MNNFFTSDFHLGHDKIRNYCNRPFKTLEEMDSTIIKNFNERVKEEDTCYYLGDFCFKKSGESPDSRKDAFDYYRNQFKCKNFIRVGGNHDKHNNARTLIESIIINHGGKKIFLTHDPKNARKEFEWNFCGHSHGARGKIVKLTDKSIIFDLSVENWDYFPVTINEINQAYSIWIREQK